MFIFLQMTVLMFNFNVHVSGPNDPRVHKVRQAQEEEKWRQETGRKRRMLPESDSRIF